MSRVNPQMIVLAREARSMNQADLAQHLSMTATNLSKLERGEIRPGEQVMRRLVESTGFPLHFFYQDGSIVPEHMGYRKRHHVTQRIMMPISARCNILRKHVQFLITALSIPPFDPVPLLVKDANALRQQWQMPPGPVENMCRLLEEHGIIVMDFDFGTDRVDSRSLITDDGQPVIFVNRRLQGDRQRFSLAFELAHLALASEIHHDPESFQRQCSAFAAAFLMPEQDIKSELEAGIQVSLLAQMKKRWKVSMISILYRADDLGLLTPNQKRYLIQQFNQMQIRRREPIELDVSGESAVNIKNWIAAYMKEHQLGILEMAALLCLQADEFQEIYS